MLPTYYGYSNESMKKTIDLYFETCQKFNIDKKKATIMLTLANTFYQECINDNKGVTNPFGWLLNQNEMIEARTKFEAFYNADGSDKEFRRLMYDANPFKRYMKFMHEQFPVEFGNEFGKTTPPKIKCL